VVFYVFLTYGTSFRIFVQESSASSNEENKKTKKSGEPKIAQKNDEGKKSPTAYSGNNKTDTVPSDSNQKLRSSASKVDSQKKEQAPLYSPKSEMTKESNMVATSQNQQWPPAAPPSKVVEYVFSKEIWTSMVVP